jgi:hypothetical protein
LKRQCEEFASKQGVMLDAGDDAYAEEDLSVIAGHRDREATTAVGLACLL